MRFKSLEYIILIDIILNEKCLLPVHNISYRKCLYSFVKYFYDQEISAITVHHLFSPYLTYYSRQ